MTAGHSTAALIEPVRYAPREKNNRAAGRPSVLSTYPVCLGYTALPKIGKPDPLEAQVISDHPPGIIYATPSFGIQRDRRVRVTRRRIMSGHPCDFCGMRDTVMKRRRRLVRGRRPHRKGDFPGSHASSAYNRRVNERE